MRGLTFKNIGGKRKRKREIEGERCLETER